MAQSGSPALAGWLRQRVVMGLVGGLLAGGCTRPAVVPPTASIPSRPAVTLSRIEPLPPDLREPVFPSPDIGDARWPTDAPLRDWKYVVLHHTATDRGSVESIHESHLKNKDKNGNPWQGIGYHFVIGNGNGMSDGEIEPTFRWRQQLAGAHAGVNDYNQHGIGIVLVGNFENASPTPAQLAAVKRLVRMLSQRCGISAEQVMGHGDVKATECPGTHFPLSEIRGSVVSTSER